MRTLILARLLSIALLSTLLSLTATRATDVDLKSKDGNTIKARLISLENGSLKILMNGKNYTIPLDKLDDDSRTTVNRWLAKGGNLSTDFEVDFDSGKRNKLADNGDIDDRRLELSPVTTITNGSTTKKTPNVEVTLIILGKPVEKRGVYRVMRKETKALNSIARLGSITLEFTSFSFIYDNDKDGTGKGSKYGGYIILIHDGTGTSHHVEAVPGSIEDRVNISALEFRVGDDFESNLRPIK